MHWPDVGGRLEVSFRNSLTLAPQLAEYVSGGSTS